MARDVHGDWRTSTKRDPHVEPLERQKRGGGGYDAGPGSTGMPSARMMDRPPSPCGAFDRSGDSRGSINRGIRKIQDQDR